MRPAPLPACPPQQGPLHQRNLTQRVLHQRNLTQRVLHQRNLTQHVLHQRNLTQRVLHVRRSSALCMSCACFMNVTCSAKFSA